jgi:hypothetical protein
MTKMSKNPKFLRSREYGLWIPTTICSIKLKENKNYMQYVDLTNCSKFSMSWNP